MSVVSLECACGKVRGTLDISNGRHLACHCRDCTNWREHLTPGRSGGVEIFQTTPDRISITEGWDQVVCAKLRENGLVRWYAKCCNTALVNTLSKPHLPFIGVVTDSIPDAERPSLGQILSIVHRPSKPTHSGMFGAAWGMVSRAIVTRLSGRDHRAPFFLPDGKLSKKPDILNK